MKSQQLHAFSLSQRTYISPATDRFFVVMRHGQALYTSQEDHGGDIVEGTLSEVGEKGVMISAMEVADVLKKQHCINIDIITSPKQRCLETATILSKTLSDNRIINSTTVNGTLRDVRVIGPQGDIPNSYTRWEDHKLPGENWFDAWKRKAAEGMQFYPGEESPNDVQVRVKAAIDEIVSLDNTTPILLVCHEEVLAALAVLFDIPWHFPKYAEVWYFYPKKTDVS